VSKSAERRERCSGGLEKDASAFILMSRGGPGIFHSPWLSSPTG
jgi:hypothetical protein